MSFSSSRYTLVCGFISVLLGFTVLVGWYLKSSLLVQIYPSFVPMQFNTALGFLISGAGLVFLCLNRPLLSTIMGYTVLLIGALTLLEYIFSWEIGIDELFMKHHITVKTMYPGRMAPNTALCFSLTGISLLVAGSLGKRFSSVLCLSIFGGLVLVLSSVATLGYLINIETAYGWGQLTRMALHTSVGFLILGSGAIALSLVNIANILTSLSWVPAFSTGGLLMVSLLFFQALSLHEKNAIKREMQSEVKALQNKVVGKLESHILSLSRMARRLQKSERESQKEWESDATEYLKHLPSFQILQRVDSSYKVRWMVSEDEKEKKLDLKGEEGLHELLKKAQFSAIPKITPPIKYTTGKKEFWIVVPLSREGKFDGFIIAVLSLEEFWGELLDSQLAKKFSLEFFQGESIAFKSVSENYFDEPFWHSRNSFQVGDATWSISYWPNKYFIDKTSSSTPFYLLLFGTFLSFAVGAIGFLILKERFRGMELKFLTHELQQTTEKNRLILESVADGIFGLDREGRTTFVNAAAEKMLGFSGDDLIGFPQHDLIHYNRPDGTPYPKEECNIYMALSEGTTQLVSDEFFWRKDGEGFPVEYISTPILDQGNIEGAVVTFRDITERKRAEEELNQFAYVVSHDLKAPLRGINHLAQFILEDIKDNNVEDVEKNFDLLRDRIRRMEEMISGLLAYSRVGRVSTTPEAVDVGELIEEIVDFISVPEGFQVAPTHNLPTIFTDKVRISQVFQNLIDNAIKHHSGEEDGLIEIDCAERGNFYEFQVIDNGEGIAPEYFNKVFLMFQTLEPRDKTGNTGLGLALIKKIVESYGGRIGVESKEGEGCKFVFTWPKTMPGA